MKASNNHNLHSEIQIINEVSHVDSARNNETRSAWQKNRRYAKQKQTLTWMTKKESKIDCFPNNL